MIYLKDGSEFKPEKSENAGNLMLLKGTSGVGKGTRVRQVLEFLKQLYTPIELFTPDERGINLELGLLFKELGIVFVGKLTISNKSGLESWTSLDHLHRIQLDVQKTATVTLKELLEYYAVVAEGNPMVGCSRYRAVRLRNESGVQKYKAWYYFYPEKGEEQYLERIVGRSGKPPKSMAAWLEDKGFRKQLRYDREELNQIDYPAELSEHPWDEDHTEFGREFLRYMKLDLVEKYNGFCRGYSALRKAVPKVE